MVEVRSPLAGQKSDWQDSATLSLSEGAPGTLVQIAGWRDFAEAAAPALQALGLDGLGDYRNVQVSGGASCFRTTPDRLLLFHTEPSALDAALELVNSARVARLDLSHSRRLVEIEGSDAAELMSRLSSVDFSMNAFQPGQMVQTGIHQISLLIHRIEAGKFHIYAPYTWAASLWDFIGDCAAPFASKRKSG